MCIAQEDIDAIRSVASVLAEDNPGITAEAWQPDGTQEFVELAASDYGPDIPGIMMLPCGHLTPGWGKIINVGYGAIRKQAQDWMDARFGNIQGGDMSKYMFYKSATIACDAATTLIKRYSALASEQAASCKDPKRKAELEKMAGGLMWISENPARDFWEACQATMLYQLYLAIAGGYPAPAFGRFDQYTWPFLKKDLESGALSMDEAQEIVDAFFLKANCFY
jgi:formate C-acetyltransferase